MSNKLGGKQGTAYLGTNADQPPNYVFNDRDPNQYDINNVSLGDLWLNQIDKNLWVLVSLAGDSMSKGSIATWVKLETGSAPGGPLDTITGTSGGPIGADSNSNINLVSGVFGLSFDGNPATNTITLNSITPDNVLETVTGNNGGPISGIAGNINIVGDNVGVTITGNPLTNTLTASLIGGWLGLFSVTGWASLITTMLFLGGISISCIGVVGLYIGRILEQVRGKPAFVVWEETDR